MKDPQSYRLLQVASLFLKLGLIAFGGPAGYVAMMRNEVVQRRRWIDDQHFFDLLGATNLIPGPNATEMANHIGYVRAGLPGLIAAGTAFTLPAASLPALVSASFSLGLLFLTFLKIGAVLYGSGYVLLAFLRADFVVRLGWMTDQQLIDAIAIGQITPGPLFTSATFIGYLLGRVPGALLATLGIFLPSFIYVIFSNPIIPRLRKSPWADRCWMESTRLRLV